MTFRGLAGRIDRVHGKGTSLMKERYRRLNDSEMRALLSLARVQLWPGFCGAEFFGGANESN